MIAHVHLIKQKSQIRPVSQLIQKYRTVMCLFPTIKVTIMINFTSLKKLQTWVTPTRTSLLTDPPTFNISPLLFRKPDPPRRNPVAMSSKTSSSVALFTFCRITFSKSKVIICSQSSNQHKQ